MADACNLPNILTPCQVLTLAIGAYQRRVGGEAVVKAEFRERSVEYDRMSLASLIEIIRGMVTSGRAAQCEHYATAAMIAGIPVGRRPFAPLYPDPTTAGRG